MQIPIENILLDIGYNAYNSHIMKYRQNVSIQCKIKGAMHLFLDTW